ncbi:hypothetical protein K4X33_10845 [Brevibacterium casei]|nr:hypothetical protein K4X33_10845 [Brevibacterium casei]
MAETVAMLREVGGLDAVEENIADRHDAALSELSAWSGGNGAAFDLGEGHGRG